MPVMANVQISSGTIGFSGSMDGREQPVLFLHGVGSDKTVWQPQLDALAGVRPCLALDYPGYGESSFQEDASRDDFATSILAAMDALAIPSAHICGLSLGGVIAIAMNHLAPSRCLSLILADTFAIHPDGQAIYDRSIAAARSMGMRALAEARAGALLGSAATSSVRSKVIETMSGIDREAYELGARAVWLADQRDRVAAIRCPALIICGDEDAITPPALSQDLSEAIDGSSLVMIEGSGHLSNLEQPAAFNQALADFLERADKI